MHSQKEYMYDMNPHKSNKKKKKNMHTKTKRNKEEKNSRKGV